MGHIQGEAWGQQTLFSVALDDLVPAYHVCRVIDAFVGRLDFQDLGFIDAEAAETGRPGYDPRDLLKLYLYGYLQKIRSFRHLETECRRNVEVMWLWERLAPDYKSIAEPEFPFWRPICVISHGGVPLCLVVAGAVTGLVARIPRCDPDGYRW